MITSDTSLVNYVVNLDAYVLSLEAGHETPPLLLRNGYKVFCEPLDTVCYLIYEIFARRCYTGSNFYCPAPGDTVLDCGAHVGIFALFLSDLAPGIKIHCFEPCGRTRSFLERNVKENRLDRAVSIYPFALSNCNCTRVLSIGAESGHSSFFDRRNNTSVRREPVGCIGLVDAVRLCKATRIHLLKIDTEGAECEILGGADDETWERIERVSVEYHEDLRPGSRACLEASLHRFRFEIVSVETAPPFNTRTGIIHAAKVP